MDALDPISLATSSQAGVPHECRCFPQDDSEFAAFVESCDLLMLDERIQDPATLERLVGRRHAGAVVHPQHPLADVGGHPVWYVF